MDFLESEIEEILNIFREESEEQIQKLNKNLLKLESNPKDRTAIAELFREAHSLKGSARMIGLNDIQAIAHKLEDIFGLAKEERLAPSSEIVDLLCKSVDCITSIVEKSILTRGKASFPEAVVVIEKLENVIHIANYGEKITETAKDTKKEIAPLKNPYSNVLNTPAIAQESQNRESSFVSPFEMVKINKELKTLIIQIRVNIEKIKIFSTNSDAIEEFLMFICQLESSLKRINREDMLQIAEDIKVKLEAALKGSGILVSDEIREIEENFEIISSGFENQPIENVKSLSSSTDTTKNTFDKDLQSLDSFSTPKLFSESKILDQVQNGSISEHIEPYETFENGEINTVETEENVFADIEIVKKSGNTSKNAEHEQIKTSINFFIKHSQDNIAKFDRAIEKIDEFAQGIGDESIRNIILKIQEILLFSKEKDAPISSDIALILQESFSSAVELMNEGQESQENPVLIVQRLSVLYQMLKITATEASAGVFDSNVQFPEAAQKASDKCEEEGMLRLPVANYSSDVLNKNRASDNAQTDKKLGIQGIDIQNGDSNTIKTLRVDTKKLDQLVNQVGELIIAKIKAKEHLSELEKMISSVEYWHREWNKTKQYIRHLEKPYKYADLPAGTSVYSQNKNIMNVFEDNSTKLSGLINRLNYLYKVIQEDDARLHLIVNELEERIKSVRVLPLATIFHMFPRMVRDIAREKNKTIDLIISGSETSVDKKIIEEIKSPLTHIIRNSIDHGIEDMQTRLDRGKNPTGKIFIAAYHLENSVLIEIIDDGRGVDIESIKRKVLQKQLLSQEELSSMTEEQIMNIIFWPGFSTGETITDISGRGIGLDIVYTKISQLNGKVKIKSTIGEGCKVSIQLPVTMATIKSFLVEVNSQKFAIPTSTINTTLLISHEHIFYKEGRKNILVDGATVPIYCLAQALEFNETNNPNNKIVVIVVQSEDVKVGFVVDKLIGDQEILHKNLSAPLLRVRNIAGVTTLGSGELCLILNVTDLVKTVYSNLGNLPKYLISQEKPQQEQIESKKILVVDDSLTTRILERNILKAAGYTVGVALNGLEALTKLSAEEYDLIVSDVEMPEINGFELTERLRSQDKFRNIPVILLTSLASETDRRKGMSLGANAYLVKGNFNQDELLKTVKRLLEKD